MKHSNFKRFLCLVLAFCMILPYCVVDISAAEEIATRIPHTQQSGENNYFTFSESGWAGGNDNHAWSGDTTSNPESVWYTVNFVGHAIDVYAGKNWPMGYVAYYIDGEYVGEFSLYQGYNSDSLFITTIDGLEEGEHVFKAVATGKNGSGGKNYIDAAEVIVYHEPYVAQSITLAETSVTLAEGATKQISYTVTPSYAELTDAVYTSSDETVATVSASGLITAVGEGNATITLTSAISGLSATVAVEVIAAVPGIAGSIVDTDTQWTQNRYDEVKGMGTLSAALTAWRNDIATSELALVSVDSALKNVTVTASDFVSGANVIDSENVTATFLRSTKAYNGSYLGYGSTTREVPADNGTNRSESVDILWSTEPADIAYNALQSVWVEIAVPADAAAGTYTGTLTVTAEGLEEALTFTYTLTVQDVTLPDASTYADTFDVELWQYPYTSAEYYGVEPFSEEHFEILRPIMEIYKSIGGHAITTTIIEEAWSGQTYSENDIHYPSMIRWEKVNGVMTYDYTDFDAWVTFCKSMGIGDKIVLYSIAPWHNNITYWENGVMKTEGIVAGGITSDSMWTAFLTDLIAHLEEKGWFEDAYIGIDERGFSAAAFDLIEGVKGSNGEPLKTAGAMDNFVNKWNLALRVTDLNVGDTAAAAHPTEFAELLVAREAKGYRTTLYSCTEHSPGQFSLSAPVESYWIILNAGMMDTAGFLRWAYDAWVADPLNDTTHNAFEAGDCFLVFPDEKDAENPQAYSSVRLERIAEGVRDVNKLMYIEKNAPSLAGAVDAVYDNITYGLTTSRNLLSASAINTLRSETAGFKADLAELTERYIALLDGATADVESVTITDGESIKVELGGTHQLTVEVLPANLLDNSLTWTSSDESIVTVAGGLLTGEGQGTATVTATSVADPSKSDSIQVTVDLMGVDESKLESYYSFDDVTGTTVADGWSEYDATMQGDASVAPGMSGNALSVNTAGVGAIVENNRELSTDWTVAYWVKTTSDFNKEISVLEDAALKYSLSLKMADTRDSGIRVGDGSGDVLTFQYNFQKDTWYHIAWVRDYDQDLKLYVNGTYVKNNTWTANRSTVMSPIDVIGGTGFTGLIDEVKIYNAPLTAAEVASAMMVDGVNLNETSVQIDAGATFQIKATVISSNSDKSVTYVSADPSIATVSDKGLVTGVARGETTITVTNPATGLSAELAVKVVKNVNIHNVLDRYVMPDKYMSTIERDPYDNGDTENRQYLGQPDMLKTETGRLITAYPMGHGKGPLIMQISDNGGLTWTEKTDTPASWAGSQETPTLYTLNVGGKERLMLITACPGWGTDSAGYQTGWNVSISDDNGDTWSEYEHFWTTFSNGNVNKVIVGMASLVQLKDENGNYIEKWMGVYHDYGYTNYKTYLTFNEDGSMNWSEPVPYLSEYRSIESSHQICEVGMFRSPDGSRIIGLARSQSHMHLSTMFWSDDEGETWSEPVELPGSLAGERHKAQYDPETGKLLITFREIWYDRDNDGLIESGDWYCGDWGLWVGTYEQLMNLEDGEYCVTIDEDFAQNTYSGDTGYAGFVVLDDGTFVMNSYGHWDEEFSVNWGFGKVTTDLCYIRQARFKLADLEADLFGTDPGGDEEDECADGHTEEIIPGTPATFDAAGKTEGKRCSVCGEVLVAQETIAQLDYNEGTIPLPDLIVSAGDWQTGYETTEGPAELAVDDNMNTIWHTDWYGTSRANHWFQFELTADYAVTGLRYKPRVQGNTNGTITRYDIQVSDDGVNFTSVATGTWESNRNWKVVEFDPQTVKYVRLVAVDAVTDNSYVFASAAEIRLVGQVPEISDADKTELNALIAEYELIEQGNYTDKSWQAFQAALQSARSTSANIYATQAQVDAAAAALILAKESLVEKTGDEPELQKIFHLDSGRKYFSKDWTIALLNELSAAGYTHLQLAFGNNGFRFLLDDMTIEANGTTYASDDIKEGVRIGNYNYGALTGYFSDDHALTEAEMDEIIAHGKAVGVEIIPHLNMPGHMSALLDAMEHVGISNPHFTGRVESDSSVDLTNEAALNFMYALTEKYAAYFAERGVKYFHIGADEYANDAYNGNMGFPSMGAALYQKFADFVNNNAAIVKSYGMTPRAWNDGISYGSYTAQFDSDIQVNYWSSGWWGYNLAKASTLNDKGHGLINTNGDYYYILGKDDRFTPGTTSTHDPSMYTACNGFDVTQFMDGSTIEEPVGATFCVWADYPGAETEQQVAANIRLILRAMALAMGGESLDGMNTGVVEGGFNEDGSINVTEEPEVNPFVDVAEDDFFYAPVLWAVENEITKGVDETHFAPYKNCNRAEVVTFLWRAAGSPEPTSTENSFVDVNEGDFFYKAVLWALEKGITKGIDDTHFGPYAECTRAQVVTFLWRAMGKPAAENEATFTDLADGAFYVDAVAWAVENGITKGISATEFGVEGTCTRGQIVTFLYRTYNN